MGIRTKLAKSLQSAISNSFLSSVSLRKLNPSLKGELTKFPRLAECIQTPEALGMNFLKDARFIQAQTFVTPEIFALNLHGVLFSPKYNILYTKSRQIIEESISTQRNLDQFDVKHFFARPVDIVNDTCSVFRSHKHCYYHTLIDNIPRLYLLHDQRFSQIDKIQVLCSGQPSPVELFYLGKLLPDNAELRIIDSNNPQLLENLIFPSFLTYRFSGYLPTEYRNWFLAKVAPKRPRKKTHRIFISRIATSKGRQRCILNEDEVFSVLQQYGFERYVLEHLSIEEQIELFYDAEAVVAAHGAGLTNTIFSQEISVLELFPSASVIPHYYYLARSLGHNYQYWCGQGKSRSSNFSVDISELSSTLASTNARLY